MAVAFDVIGVPSSMGAFAPGQEKAPEAYRASGLVARLAASGVDAEDLGDAPVRRWLPDRAHRRAQHVDMVTRVATETAARVRSSTERHRLPLVLGGDCTVGLGTIAGLRDGASLGLVYFDLHTDMNLPSTVPQGALDWMGMAHALAFEGTEERLTAFGPRVPLLEPNEVVFFGVGPDALTAFEREQLTSRALLRIEAPDVEAHPEASAERALALLESADRILVHLDVDVIDYMDLPLSENAGRNEGLTFASTMRAFGELVATPRLAAITVCELNPDHDPDGSAMERLVAGMVEGLSGAAQRETADPTTSP